MKRLIDLLTPEARVTVLTGAGVSAASGVPTFRSPGGLWRNFRPEALATAEAFGRDPSVVWQWYAWRRSLRWWREDTLSFKRLPPQCPYCAGLIRPAVVWFGETLEPNVVSQALDAARCDIFITIGTSSVVYPAAGLIEQARKQGAFTVEINPESTPATQRVDLALKGGAETILPEIDKQILARLSVV